MNPKTRNWLIVGAVVMVALCLCTVIAGVAGALVFQARTSSKVYTTAIVITQVVPPPLEATPVPTQTPIPTATEPAPTVEPTAALPAALPAVDFEGVRFSYDPALASNIQAEVIEEEPGTVDGPYWERLPRHVRFEFEGYPRQGETFHQAEVLIYPVEDYARLSEGAGPVIEELKQALKDRPSEFDNGLPFLPQWNAAQMFHAQLRYLDSGLRYVTQYGQDISPITNERVFYTYQGLAGNGKYYVVAIFPISSAVLPDSGEVDDYQAFADRYQQFMKETRDALNAEPAENFAPDLELLDALVESITVE